jgi:hypothetical protein
MTNVKDAETQRAYLRSGYFLTFCKFNLCILCAYVLNLFLVKRPLKIAAGKLLGINPLID